MSIDRYHRQALLPQIGKAGQERLSRSRVLLIGCGALGSVIAEQLVRAGIGSLRIADRDWVELTNLQRQVLFDESDVAEQRPKAIAAAERLKRINSQVAIDPKVVDVHAGNIAELAGLERGGSPVDVILDGCDNVETRYLINELSVKHGVPWIYGACVGTEGRCLPIQKNGPCLRCVFPEPPAPAELPTCDTAGVSASAAAVVASLQVTSALHILISGEPEIEPLIIVDVWRGRFQNVSMHEAKRMDCPTCGRRSFPLLENPATGRRTVSLCGRNAVQVRMGQLRELNLGDLASKLQLSGEFVQRSNHLLRCQLREPHGIQLTVFPDGRAIIQGTTDFDRANSIYARFVGN